MDFYINNHLLARMYFLIQFYIIIILICIFKFLFIIFIKLIYKYCSAERQSIASANRKGEGLEKRPDFMYLVKRENKIFELIFGECSRAICDNNKKKGDEIKLWRETNDGMFWVRQTCKPENEQFGIIGIQIAGIIYFILFNLL